MNVQIFFDLLRRQWITLIIIVLATTFAASTLFYFQPTQEKITLLFSVGVDETSVSEKSFDATKLSDDFAKTISGWMRSPTMAERVSGISGVPVGLSASGQAKQNFLVEVSYAEGNSDTITAATKQVITDEIQKYNAKSKFKFFTTTHGESLGTSGGDYKKTIVAAGAGGLLLAILWITLSAYLGGRVISTYEAERLLKTKATIVFRGVKKGELAFLKKITKKANNAVLIGTDTNVEKLREKLGINIKTAELPRDAGKISKNETKIVVVKIGTSKANTLRMLRAVFEDKIKLIVWS